MKKQAMNFRNLALVLLVVGLWVHASEVARYFLLVMGETRSFFYSREVATMNLPIFAIWGAWVTVLVLVQVYFFLLHFRVYGVSFRSVLTIANLCWAFLFVLFWVACANMGLARWSFLPVVLPLAWFEVFVAASICGWVVARRPVFLGAET